jgi:hypothetical protein
MRSILLLVLLLAAGCKFDWAGPNLECLTTSPSEGACPAPNDSLATVSIADSLSLAAVQGE